MYALNYMHCCYGSSSSYMITNQNCPGKVINDALQALFSNNVVFYYWSDITTAS